MRYAVGWVLLLALTGWAALDAARRGRSWYGWSRLVFFTGIFGFVAWLVVRRRAPLEDWRMGAWRSGLIALSGVPLLACGLLATTCVVTFVVQTARVEGQA